jgi:thermitase
VPCVAAHAVPPYPGLFMIMKYSLITPALSAAVAVLAANVHAAEVQVLVKPKAMMPDVALQALIAANGGQEHDAIEVLDVRIVRVSERAAAGLLRALESNPGIEYAEMDGVATAFTISNDPLFTGNKQWYLPKIEAPSAWTTTTGGTVTIAVLDTGVLATHPDISGQVLPGRDFVNNDNDATDDNGHGTAVAGVSSALTGNGTGMASVAPATQVLPVKVLNASGSGSYAGISNGITWAADNGASVINLSLGGGTSSTTLQNAVNYAWGKGVVLVAAAGNSGSRSKSYPAACDNVVAVSATNSSDGRPSWSNYGDWIQVSAPGVDIVTLTLSGYASTNGTSFSSPVASGVVALMRAANPALSNAEVVDLLLKNSDDIGAKGYDVYYGHGRVNARRAVAAAAATVPPPVADEPVAVDPVAGDPAEDVPAVDEIAPTAKITSPSDGTKLGNRVQVTVEASDNVGVTRIELHIDGSLFGSSTSNPAVFNWNTQKLAKGQYRLEAIAYDAAANKGSSEVVTVTK